MTITHPSGDVSRFYEPARKPFKLDRRVGVAVAAAVGFHAIVGYYVVKSHFEAAQLSWEEGPVIKFIDYLPVPPPPPPPPTTKTQDVIKPPPQNTLAFRETTSSFPSPDPIVGPVSPDPTPAAGPVAAPDPAPTPVTPSIPKSPSIIRNPTWLKKPTADQVGALYPRKAAEAGVTGTAVILCDVQASGAVGNCEITDETPKGYRFGDAALRMTRYFKINPRTVDGEVETGARVRIPIVFNLG